VLIPSIEASLSDTSLDLFIYGSCKDAVSITDCEVSDGRKGNEERIEKQVQGCSPGIFLEGLTDTTNCLIQGNGDCVP
jgi:hypothetical protein